MVGTLHSCQSFLSETGSTRSFFMYIFIHFVKHVHTEVTADELPCQTTGKTKHVMEKVTL